MIISNRNTQHLHKNTHIKHVYNFLHFGESNQKMGENKL